MLTKRFLFSVAMTGWTIAAIGAAAMLISCAPASTGAVEQGSTTSSDTAPITEQSKDCACPYTAGSSAALTSCTPATAAQIAADPTTLSYSNSDSCHGVVVR